MAMAVINKTGNSKFGVQTLVCRNLQRSEKVACLSPIQLMINECNDIADACRCNKLKFELQTNS
jgi:hypothetical protein